MSMIRIYSGPPGAGKSTLARQWAASRPRGLCIPVDDLRLWVVGGIADTLPEWTDETTRQFALAEDAAVLVAKIYTAAGFDVAIDHCRMPENIDAMVERAFAGGTVEKIAVLPPLDVVLQRNRERTNKDFDPMVLEPIIKVVHAAYAAADLSSWTLDPNP